MGTNVSVADTAEAAAPTATTTEEIEQADPAATVPLPVPLSVHDYSCPICLELLLRPVKLSCGHRFCRGCWVRVLQSRDGRAAANTTGSAACPFRCEVRPVVPEVDQALASVLESHFEEQYTERASAYALPDEEHKATEVNAWAAAGCPLVDCHTPEELIPTIAEAAAALRSTAEASRRVQAHLRRLARVEEQGSRQRLLQTMNRVLGVAGAVLGFLLLAVLMCIMVAVVVRAHSTIRTLLLVLRETFIFCVVLLAGLGMLRHCAQRRVQWHIDAHGHAGRAAVRRVPQHGGPSFTDGRSLAFTNTGPHPWRA